jgi:lipopolysaccharide/colanic/teichoic acid biosynthesis glycosyltransferase
MIRFFDILFSFTAILLLFPFMVPVMIALKLTGEHYIFYRQRRIGKGGKEFKILKFATMLKDSPNMSGGVLTQKNDIRILPMGKFLRKTKINELPQLVNILIGQMSFIGPRPQAKQHYNLYSDEVKFAISTIAPGLSGIGSIVFRDEENILDKVFMERDKFHDTVITPYKGKLELWFCEHRTLRTYFLTIFLTFFALIKPNSNLFVYFFKDLPEMPEGLKQYFVTPGFNHKEISKFLNKKYEIEGSK